MKPLVIIESPYAAPTEAGVEANKKYARRCILHSLSRGEAPIASHLLLTQVLSDNYEHERNLGVEAGLAWYRVADKCVVYADRGYSKGMGEGIARAHTHGVPVEFRTIEGED